MPLKLRSISKHSSDDRRNGFDETSAAAPLAHWVTCKQVLLLYLSSRTKITTRNQEPALVWQNPIALWSKQAMVNDLPSEWWSNMHHLDSRDLMVILRIGFAFDCQIILGCYTRGNECWMSLEWGWGWYSSNALSNNAMLYVIFWLYYALITNGKSRAK